MTQDSKGLTLRKLLQQLWVDDQKLRLQYANKLVDWCESNGVQTGRLIVMVGDRSDTLERQATMIDELEAKIRERDREIEFLRQNAPDKLRRKAIRARTEDVVINRWQEFKEKAIRGMGLNTAHLPHGWVKILAHEIQVDHQEIRKYGKGSPIPEDVWSRLDALKPVTVPPKEISRRVRSKGKREEKGNTHASGTGPVPSMPLSTPPS